MDRCSSPTTTTGRSIASLTAADGYLPAERLRSIFRKEVERISVRSTSLLRLHRDLSGMRAVLTALTLLAGMAGALAASVQERMAICFSCHGENGQSPNPETPSIGAQPSPYVLIQLYLFRERQRVVDAMNQVTKGLTDKDLQAFSDAISKLPAPQLTTEPGDPQRLQRARDLVQKYR